jgi:hypothetical protein
MQQILSIPFCFFSFSFCLEEVLSTSHCSTSLINQHTFHQFKNKQSVNTQAKQNKTLTKKNKQMTNEKWCVHVFHSSFELIFSNWIREWVCKRLLQNKFKVLWQTLDSKLSFTTIFLFSCCRFHCSYFIFCLKQSSHHKKILCLFYQHYHSLLNFDSIQSK